MFQLNRSWRDTNKFSNSGAGGLPAILCVSWLGDLFSKWIYAYVLRQDPAADARMGRETRPPSLLCHVLNLCEPDVLALG